MLKMRLSSFFIMSSSSTQLSTAISVFLAAITHFTQTFFQYNKPSLRVTFGGQFWVWLGKCPLGSKLISGGGGCSKNDLVCIFDKINSRGEGDVCSGLESRFPDTLVLRYLSRLSA